ncbi:MAG TPA: hypothetical protein VLT59_06510, partial [Steroidobacteraceae bacterium]|nr:hypothetical protein [Steroidobacteraceae bacterium]
GMDLALALQFTPDGSIEWLSPPGRIALPTTRWRIARSIRSEAPGDARLSATLEDTPFYARSLLATRLAGETAPAIHETLSLDRFRTRWVKLLLPFRMPRAWR